MTAPFPPNSISALTGMASGPKKTRRGGRSKLGSMGKHVANAISAHKAGDHATARGHLFKAIRSLPVSGPDAEGAQDAIPEEDDTNVSAKPLAAIRPLTPNTAGPEANPASFVSDTARRQKLVATLKGLHK